MRVPLCLCLALSLAACGHDAPPPNRGGHHDLLEVRDEGQDALRASLDLALGDVRVGRAEAGTLLQVETRSPLVDLRPTLRAETVEDDGETVARAHVELEGEAASLGDLRRGGGIEWSLLFSDRVPMDLGIELGAAEADLDLSGLPIRRLALSCGVARTRLRFEEPNPEVLRDLTIEAGVSEFSGEVLGNARFERLSFEGGVGRFRLDFSGEKPRPGARADLQIGVASLEVVLPADVPVVVSGLDARLAAVRLPDALEPLGGGRYATEGAADDPEAFQVHVEAGPGKIRFRMDG